MNPKAIASAGLVDIGNSPFLFQIVSCEEYRKYVRTPEIGAGRFYLVLVSSGVMIFFALESFWKSRKPR